VALPRKERRGGWKNWNWGTENKKRSIGRKILAAGTVCQGKGFRVDQLFTQSSSAGVIEEHPGTWSQCSGKGRS